MHTIHAYIARDGFRLRGTEMSRIDGFSDVVFGFALTLIVVSLEVPRTYAELHELVLSFLPFFICFVFLFMVWWAHYRFFRRYGLHQRSVALHHSLLRLSAQVSLVPRRASVFSSRAGRRRESRSGLH